MRIVLIIILFAPSLALSQWYNYGKTQKNQNTFNGRVRYIPKDNSAIFETKDSIVKLDLESGEIIKRIDLDITDTNYVQVVADDDLNNAYLLSRKVERKSGDIASHVILVTEYFSKKVIITDTVENIPISYITFYKDVNLNLNLLYTFHSLIISYDLNINSHYINERTQETKVFHLTDDTTTYLKGQTPGLIDSYNNINPISKIAISDNYYGYYKNNPSFVDKSYTELFIVYISSGTTRLLQKKDPSESYSDFAIQNHSGKYILKKIGGIFTSGIQKWIKLPFYGGSDYAFSYNDQLIFNTYSFYGKVYYNITDLSGVIIDKDSSNLIHNTNIRFNDGQHFYFIDRDTLIKYTPNYLKSDNIESIFVFEKDTIFYGENLKTVNLSSGLPENTTWLVDDKTVSNELTLDYLIESDGFHDVSLISKNSFKADTLTKQILIKKLKNYNNENIDFEIEFLNTSPREIRLVAVGNTGGYDLNWNFGDGKIAEGKTVEHKYKINENYTVTLTAVNNESIIQVIKQNILDLFEITPDYSKNIFEKYSTRGGDKIYIRTHGVMKNINLEILNYEGLTLFMKYYDYLPKGEIIVLDNIGTFDLKFVVTTSDGVKYEY